jgi:hypothetical protein
LWQHRQGEKEETVIQTKEKEEAVIQSNDPLLHPFLDRGQRQQFGEKHAYRHKQ